MAHTIRRAGNSQGFSLLELLISLLLIVSIASIAGMALRFGYRSLEAGMRKMDAAERFRSSLMNVVAQIESQIPLIFEEENEKSLSFRGNGRAMQFATNFSIWDDRYGYVLTKYTIGIDEGEKHFLMVTETDIAVESERTTILFKALDDISFEYFYRDPTGEGRWMSEWSGDPIADLQFPECMRLNIIRGTERYAPVIPMRTGSSDIGEGRVLQVPSKAK